MTKFKVFFYLNVAFIFTTIPFYIYYQQHFKEDQCSHCTTNNVELEGTAVLHVDRTVYAMFRKHCWMLVQKTLLNVDLNKIHETV